MKQAMSSLVLMILLILVSSSSAIHKTCFLRHPEPILYEDEGKNITMVWDYHIQARPQSGTQIKDFLFGEWASPGYVKFKILYMDLRHKVKTRPGYDEKVYYRGNISKCANCSAVVTIRHLKPRDFKKYGIDILVGLHRSPLINFFELRAPPRIIMFTQNLDVQQGNKTTIGCKAKGIPAPIVKIRRNNQTLCNDTLYCQYFIENVDTEDEGEYECIAKQGVRSDNSSMKLNVLRKDDLQSTTEIPIMLIMMIILAIAFVVAVLAAVCCYWKRKTTYKFEKVVKI